MTTKIKHKIIYHGSSHKLTSLDPKPSKVIDGENAVFGTDSKPLSAIFIPKWSDCDLDLGYYKGVLYCTEVYHGAFDILKGVSGYIYHLDGKQFESDKRLGMINHEFISRKSVKVIKAEKINDVYEYLKKSEIRLITYDQKLQSLWNSGLIKPF